MRTLNIVFLLALFSSNGSTASDHLPPFYNTEPPAFVQQAIQVYNQIPPVPPAQMEVTRLELITNIRNFFNDTASIDSENVRRLAFGVVSPAHGTPILGMGEDLRRFMQSNLWHLLNDDNGANEDAKEASRLILEGPAYNFDDNDQAVINARDTLYQ